MVNEASVAGEDALEGSENFVKDGISSVVGMTMEITHPAWIYKAHKVLTHNKVINESGCNTLAIELTEQLLSSVISNV